MCFFPPLFVINLAANMSLQMKYGVLGRVKQTVLKSTLINAQQGTLPLQNKLHLDLLHDELIPDRRQAPELQRKSLYILSIFGCLVNGSAASFWRLSFSYKQKKCKLFFFEAN